MHGAARTNSRGLDLADETTLAALAQAFADTAHPPWRAEPMLDASASHADWTPVKNPAQQGSVVGQVREAAVADVHRAAAAAARAAPAWAATSPAARAACLEGAADRLEHDALALIPLLVREAGKTCANAVAEVREAVDFLRYYAAEVRRDFDNATHLPLGPVACISPWNFPLAIFTG